MNTDVERADRIAIPVVYEPDTVDAAVFRHSEHGQKDGAG